MVGKIFKPFFRRFIGLFFSMVFVSALSIGLLASFASTIYNLKKTLTEYLADYGDVDAVVNYAFSAKSDFNDILEVEGVEAVEYRLTMDVFLQKSDGRTITSRIFTFKDTLSSLFGRYVLEKTDPVSDKINVSVVRKFAANNGFKLGDTIKIGYFGFFIECYIDEIVETPEAMQARANNYVWSDNTDFGYLYVDENELDKALYKLAVLLEDKINSDDDFRVLYENIVNSVGATFPDIVNRIEELVHYTEKYANQILIKAQSGYTQEEVAYNVKTYMENKDVKVKSATENHNMFYYVYIEHAIKQLQVAAIFLPVFFYAVTMIVIGLFTNQIIKTMTPQIGIMVSVGVGKMDIVSVFMMFSFVMSLAAGVFGTAVGLILNRMLAAVMIKVYSIPVIPFGANAVITALSIISLVVFAQVSTVLSCKRIFKITPKDAMISNEAARKRLPAKLETFINNSPISFKLAFNSIAQNPRRFFVSVFSIFASFVIILLSLFFNVSKTELMAQTVERRLSFDAQVYMTSVADDSLVAEIKSKPFVEEMIDCYYTYAEVSAIDGGKHTYIECLAYDDTVENNLVVIPDKNGKNSIDIGNSGLILPSSAAETLGVGKGDVVKVNGVPVMVSDISFQYFHTITYLSKAQMDDLKLQYVSSFLVDVNDEDAFLAYMSENNASLTVFTKSLSKDIHDIFNSIDVFIYIMIGFSLFMGFIILSIMSQNALMEQKRQLSVFRAIGFTVLDVSNLWTVQSVSHLILSTVIAIPFGALSAAILFKLCSSSAQIYPFIFSFSAVLFGFVFILAIIIVSHLISMLTIKRWNLADNTRSRE